MKPAKTILMTGATGLIGSALCPVLESKGHKVLRLTRGTGQFSWDPASGRIDPTILKGVDAVIHLAGENVAQRWTPNAKKRIRESRIKGTRLLVQAMRQQTERPDLIMASGINYYGYDEADPKNEDAPSGPGFLGNICREWEMAAMPWSQAGGRVVYVRTGVVLSASGGALAKMLPPFKAGLGGSFGSGKQRMSWIAIQDLVSIYERALEDSTFSGPVNAVAPKAAAVAEFAQTLGSVLKRPAFLPAPAFALKIAFGEMATETILSDLNILPQRLQNANFKWNYPDIQSALAANI
jgi:uncharacterized protein (TIGR01777 family)